MGKFTLRSAFGVSRRSREQPGQDGTELRHTLRQLCDVTLADGAATPGLDAAVRRIAALMPFPVRVTVDCGALTPVVASTAYAMICEALGNAAGHAAAHHAIVTVRRHGPTVQLSVSDDGDGGAQPVLGGGIVMLAGRAAALGGLLHVDSAPGSGTHLTMELPLGA